MLSSSAWGKVLLLCTYTPSFASTNDAKILCSRDVQCNTEESTSTNLPFQSSWRSAHRGFVNNFLARGQLFFSRQNLPNWNSVKEKGFCRSSKQTGKVILRPSAQPLIRPLQYSASLFPWLKVFEQAKAHCIKNVLASLFHYFQPLTMGKIDSHRK